MAFANFSLKYDYFRGTDFSPVGYLQGIFVKEDFRKRSYGKSLIENVKSWKGPRNLVNLPEFFIR